MSRESFLEKIKNTLNERDYKLVEAATQVLLKNIAPNGDGVLWNPYRAITPSLHVWEGSTKPCFAGIWNWDSAFHMMGVSRFDKELAHEQMKAFFLFQKEDGMLPDVITHPLDGSVKILDKYSKPPVWAWALENMDRRQPDDDFLKEMYPKLVKNESFWTTQRYNEEDGLFFYSTSIKDVDSETGIDRYMAICYESGLDDSVRFDDGILEFLYPIDLNSFMVSFYKSMQYLALRLDLADDAQKWYEKEKELCSRIQKTLWSEEDECFFDWNFKEKDFNRIITPAIFMPLWAGAATPKQAAAVERFAKDPEKLYPYMPSVSFDHPKFDPTKYVAGAVWINVAYFAVKGLYDYGFRKTSMDIRKTLLDLIDKTYQKYNFFCESYNSETQIGKGAVDFSWTCVFTMEMIFETK